MVELRNSQEPEQGWRVKVWPRCPYCGQECQHEAGCRYCQPTLQLVKPEIAVRCGDGNIPV